MTHRLVLAIFLHFLRLSTARVTFDQSEVLDQSDITDGNTTFNCPSGCRVYTPTSSTLKIVDEGSVVVISFTDLKARAIDNPLELEPGNYSVINEVSGDPPEFVLYVVQKGANNYNTKVYTSPGRIDATEERYITVLTDVPGLRLNEIGGDLKDNKPAVYAVGADSMNKCRPVFQSRSFDNAQLTSVSILGPIAAIDFGTDKGNHVVTFNFDYLTGPTTELGSSTIQVTPGYTGCGSDSVGSFSKQYDSGVKIDTEYKLSSDKEIALTFTADYSIAPGTPPVEITINEDVIRLEGTDSIVRNFVATEISVFFDLTRQKGDTSYFAIQIDNLLKSATNFGLGHIALVSIFVLRRFA